MFGALRRLLQSGDIRSVLQESRRSFSDIAAVLGTPTNRARQSALDNMNAPNPIEAPYEGFRVWPEGNRWNDGPIPPWQGGGRGPVAEPYWTEFGPFDEAYRPFMSNNPEWHPLDMNVPPAFGGPVDPYNPNLYRHPGQKIKSVIPFNEMMRARGSLFDDPRYMPPF